MGILRWLCEFIRDIFDFFHADWNCQNWDYNLDDDQLEKK